MTPDDLTSFGTWKPLAVTVGGVLVVLGLVFGAGYWQGQRKGSTAATQAENMANVAKGEAYAIKAQALAKDAEIQAKDNGLAEARADLARRTAELARVRGALLSKPATVPGAPESILAGSVDLAPVVEKQHEVIQAQAVLITELDTRVFDLTRSRDLWKTSAEAREREAAGLRIALEAQKSLTKGALWRGRFQGLAVGIGSGYLVGKMR